MNKVILMGRLTRDPEVRYSQRGNSQEEICVARYTLAVERRGKDGGADFPSVVAFGKAGEFAEKYLRKGMKIVLTGRMQTGSYTNRDDVKVYTTDVIAEEQEFAESKAAAGQAQQGNGQAAVEDYPTDGRGFINIPDGIDEELPFS
ncbi:MAG: single-stranded DNA-binding protein [Lachnospiraceae bacterium]|nr:single-stranded DNA-binding protein [Lachnospiraceae bacterium]